MLGKIDYIPHSTFPVRKAVDTRPFKLALVGLYSFNVEAMLNGLLECGATLSYVWDNEEPALNSFLAKHPNCISTSIAKILSSDSDMIINCMRPDQRIKLSVLALEKHYPVLSDAPGFLKEEDGQILKNTVLHNNGRYFIYFDEHFHNEGCISAQNLIEEGKIGRVLTYSDTSSFYLNSKETDSRFDFLFHPSEGGDIFINTMSRSIEQFLLMTNNINAKITHVSRRNIAHPEYPLFYDFGEINLLGDNGATGYIKSDWLKPNNSNPDCRCTITGKKGTIEIRKYSDPGIAASTDNIYLTDNTKTSIIHAQNSTGFPFFSKLILDCLEKKSGCSLKANGISLSLFCIKAMEISIKACNQASNISVNL